MSRQRALFTLTNGLQGLYMPDGHWGPYCVHTRKELIETVRDVMRMLDVTNIERRLRDIKWRDGVWPHIKRHGASSLHFCIAIDEHNMIEFHGLTVDEYNEQLKGQCSENGEPFEPLE
jgi:hypothetical protein